MIRIPGMRAAVVSIVVGVALFGGAAGARADAGWVSAPATPLQFAFGPPDAQVFTKATPVYGLRLSLLYGVQKKLSGLDVGPFGDVYSLDGVQIGLGNQVLKKLHGVQLGVANSADAGGGLQIGLLNRSHGMKGLQIGLINIHDEGLLPWLPFFNFHF